MRFTVKVSSSRPRSTIIPPVVCDTLAEPAQHARAYLRRSSLVAHAAHNETDAHGRKTNVAPATNRARDHRQRVFITIAIINGIVIVRIGRTISSLRINVHASCPAPHTYVPCIARYRSVD